MKNEFHMLVIQKDIDNESAYLGRWIVAGKVIVVSTILFERIAKKLSADFMVTREGKQGTEVFFGVHNLTMKTVKSFQKDLNIKSSAPAMFDVINYLDRTIQTSGVKSSDIINVLLKSKI